MIVFMGIMMIIFGLVNMKSSIESKRASLIGLSVVLVLVDVWCTYIFIQEA